MDYRYNFFKSLWSDACEMGWWLWVRIVIFLVGFFSFMAMLMGGVAAQDIEGSRVGVGRVAVRVDSVMVGDSVVVADSLGWLDGFVGTNYNMTWDGSILGERMYLFGRDVSSLDSDRGGVMLGASAASGFVGDSLVLVNRRLINSLMFKVGELEGKLASLSMLITIMLQVEAVKMLEDGGGVEGGCECPECRGDGGEGKL